MWQDGHSPSSSSTTPTLIRIIQQVQLDEIYDLVVQRYVAVSLESPDYAVNSDVLGTLEEP